MQEHVSALPNSSWKQACGSKPHWKASVVIWLQYIMMLGVLFAASHSLVKVRCHWVLSSCFKLAAVRKIVQMSKYEVPQAAFNYFKPYFMLHRVPLVLGILEKIINAKFIFVTKNEHRTFWSATWAVRKLLKLQLIWFCAVVLPVCSGGQGILKAAWNQTKLTG